MSGTVTMKVLAAANRWQLFLNLTGAAICAAALVFCTASAAHADIVSSGDVSPTDPASWTGGNTGYVGEKSLGTVVVDGGTNLWSRNGFLGYDSGSTGAVMVTGTGSKWSNTYGLYVGYNGQGTLNIEAGAQVSDSYSYLGYGASSTGKVTVTGIGSTWICSGDLRVGDSGSGTLTVTDGGAVTAGTLFASLSDLSGNGIITATKGALLDADLTFDASHGQQQTLSFGTGGTLNLNPTKWGSLGAGYKHSGTLRIADGVKISSTYGTLGKHSGSIGTATITGAGSKWASTYLSVGSSGSGTLNVEAGGQVSSATGFMGNGVGSTGAATITGPGSSWNNSGNLYVGGSGSGTLTVSNGGVVTAGTLFASPKSLLGNGVITTQGVVLDTDIVFDSTHAAQQTFSFGTGGKLNLAMDGAHALGVGCKDIGTLTITDGVTVTSSHGYLGYNSGSVGTATVTGAGSQWINNVVAGSTSSSSLLYVGYNGSGTLNIAAGGKVSDYTSYLGYYSGSTGTVTVTSPGSQWTTDGELYVGNRGNGTLNIAAGGQISSSISYLGYSSGAVGTATVTGVGSKWTNSGDLYVGCYGNGVLNVSDGGAITTKTLYASPSSLSGNGVITAQGVVLDVDLVFDRTHGRQQTFSFGTGGRLNLNLDGTAGLGAGHNGAGTLRIADGVAIESSAGTLGRRLGSTGTATVTGAGSKWTNSGALFVGNYGSGVLNIEAGGQVSNSTSYVGYGSKTIGTVTVTGAGSTWTNNDRLSIGYYGKGVLSVEAGAQVISSYSDLGVGSDSTCTVTVAGNGSKWTNGGDLRVAADSTLTVANGGVVSTGTLYASLDDLLGNGTITTRGAVLDADLVFDRTHGSPTTLVFGTSGALNISLDGNSALGAGYKGAGTLRIADGVAVASSDGYLGYRTGSTGTATVTGNGSKWTNNASLDVGYDGKGTLTIEAGGQMVNNAACYVGYNDSSFGSVTVRGAGSRWTVGSDLYLGYYGNGTLNVADGGAVTAGTLYASLGNLSGNGTISAQGAILDADIVVDARHGIQEPIPFGTGGALNLNLSGTSVLGIGYRGDGTLRIADGKSLAVSQGYLGYSSGSTGTATVTGAGSTWTTSGDLAVGYFGNGVLLIAAGGQVNSATSVLSYYDGSGTATVTGAGSKWTTSGTLSVGLYHGEGTLNVESGGEVHSAEGYIGHYYSPGTVTVTGVGSKWTTDYTVCVGFEDKGSLVVQAGGLVNSSYGQLALFSGSAATATVTGAGSKWVVSGGFSVGGGGNAALSIEAGGAVNNADGWLGGDPGSTGKVTVTGTGSAWTNSGTLYVGESGNGTLNVELGAQTIAATGYLGAGVGSTGTATITGTGSTWTNTGTLFVGGSGNGTLNVDSGGMAKAMTLTLADGARSRGTCHIDKGGILRVAAITQGAGVANLLWDDGVIQNYDAGTDLVISNGTPLKLPSTGTHAFQIDLNRTGRVDAILSDATTQGTFAKTGPGILKLNADNTFTGSATIADGILVAGHANALGTTGTIINNATLAIAPGITFTRPVAWGNASVLAGSGIYKPGGTFTVGTTTPGNASALSPGIGAGNVGTLTIGNHLSLDGATLMWDAASDTSCDAVAVQGNLALRNTNTVVSPTLGNGTYIIMTYAGNLTGNATNLAASAVPGLIRPGVCNFNTSTPGIVKMLVSGAGANYSLIWSGRAGSDWSVASPKNWTGNDSTFYNGDAVTFDDSSLVGAVQLARFSPTVTLQPASVTVNNSTTPYTFNGDPISGAGGLTKSGSGTLTVNTANAYTGDTIIRGGTLVVGVATAIPSGAGRGNVVLDGGATAGVLNLNGKSITLNGLCGTSGAVLGRVVNDGAAATLTIGGNNATSAFAGNIANGSGAVSVVKTGSGTLTLSGNNSYTGTTTVSAGTLMLSGDNSAASGLTTVNGGTLTIAGAKPLGGGGVTVTGGRLNINDATALGSGVLSLSGGAIDNTSIAPIIISGANAITVGGDFAFAGAQPLNLGTGPVALGAATHTWTVSANTLTVEGVLSGSAGLTKSGAGTLALSGNNSYTGPTMVSAGTLILSGNNSAASGLITVNGGTLTLASAKPLGSGGVTLTSGTLNITNATALGSGMLTLSGGAINNTSIGSIVNSGANPITVGGNITFSGAQSLDLGSGPVTLGATSRIWSISANTLTLGGVLSGSAGLAKTGNGTLILSGKNTFTGVTTVSAGTLILSGDNNATRGLTTVSGGALTLNSTNALGIGGVMLSSGTLNINNASALGSGKLTLFGGAIDNTSGVPIVNTCANLISVGGNFTFAGAQSLDLGNGAVTLLGPAARTWTVSASTLTFRGVLSGTSGVPGITKTGNGTLVLSGNNTYTGATTVSGGKLLINGSLLASPVTINGGGTLGGSGTIARLLTVNTAGTLAPGNSIGTLTLGGGLTLASGAKLDFELGSTTASDLISMPPSTLTLNSQQFSDFHFTSMDGFGRGTYTLIDAKLISGSLGTNTSGTINGLPATLYVDAAGNDLMLNVVPEPSTVALLGMGAVGLLAYAWRRRKAN